MYYGKATDLKAARNLAAYRTTSDILNNIPVMHPDELPRCSVAEKAAARGATIINHTAIPPPEESEGDGESEESESQKKRKYTKRGRKLRRQASKDDVPMYLYTLSPKLSQGIIKTLAIQWVYNHTPEAGVVAVVSAAIGVPSVCLCQSKQHEQAFAKSALKSIEESMLQPKHPWASEVAGEPLRSKQYTTAGYRAPELWAKDQHGSCSAAAVDFPADQWSYGVVLWELVHPPQRQPEDYRSLFYSGRHNENDIHAEICSYCTERRLPTGPTPLRWQRAFSKLGQFAAAVLSFLEPDPARRSKFGVRLSCGDSA